MTAGHRHHTLRVRRDGILHRVLTRPTLARADGERADRSRLVWGPVPGVADAYRLSPLGVLHALTGLTLEVR